MSQCINFYIKTSNNEFILIWNISRNNYIYSCADVPYRKISKLTETKIKEFQKELTKSKDTFLKQKEKLNLYKIDLLNSNNSEALNKVSELYKDFSELDEEIEDIKFANMFYENLLLILNTFKYYTENKYSLYAGVEAPIYPTKEDIIE